MFHFPRKWGIAAVAAGMLLTVTAGAGLQEAEGAQDIAVTINGTDYTLAQFNYYFQSWYDSFSTENAALLPYMFDQSKSLKEQEYEDGRSWFDYFVDESCESMQQIVTLAEEAKKADFVLSKQAHAQVDEVLNTVTDFAGTLGMEADDYLAYFYGEGMDLEEFTACLSDARLADGYAQQVRESFAPDAEQLEAYYTEHTRDFTTVSYERYFARASAMGTQATPEQLEKAKAVADQVYEKVKGGISLQEATQQLSKETGTYHAFDDAQYLDGSVYGDWLFDPERKAGDLFLTQEVNGWYVMVFHSRELADYASISVMDAVFPVDEADGSMDEQLEASCLKAEAFLEEWKKAGAGEAAFEAMARLQSRESGAAFDYPSLTKDVFSAGLNKWAFARERKIGEAAVLYDPEGFHVLYYAGESVPAWQVKAADALKEEAFGSWFDELMKGSELTRHEDVLAHAGGYEN